MLCDCENLESKGYIHLHISVVQKACIIISGGDYLRTDNSQLHVIEKD